MNLEVEGHRGVDTRSEPWEWILFLAGVRVMVARHQSAE